MTYLQHGAMVAWTCMPACRSLPSREACRAAGPYGMTAEGLAELLGRLANRYGPNGRGALIQDWLAGMTVNALDRSLEI